MSRLDTAERKRDKDLHSHAGVILDQQLRSHAMPQQATTTEELAFSQPFGEQERQILTPEAVEFLSELVTRFTPRRNKLLAARIQQQQEIDDGKLPDFISETASIRNGEWQIRGIPQDLLDRRVEITGPVERKMVINALNANVKVLMASIAD